MLLGLDRVGISGGEEAMYKEKYENLLNTVKCFMFLQSVDVVDFPECDCSTTDYVGMSSKAKVISIPNCPSLDKTYCFSKSNTLETFSANNVTIIGPSSLRDCTALKTVYLDSLTSLGSTYALTGNTALEDLYIRKKTAAQLLAWTDLLNRIPTTCTVHGSDRNVVYDSETSEWVISASNGGGCKLTCARRSYRRSLRPSARFYTSRQWKEAA